MSDLTHFDEAGNARMVDVSDKDASERIATAKGSVYMAPATLALIRDRGVKKGDVLTVAQLAGIMGAKRTPDLIPLCHPLGAHLGQGRAGAGRCAQRGRYHRHLQAGGQDRGRDGSADRRLGRRPHRL